MSNYRDFLLSVASTGRILGAGIGSTPEQWRQSLGDDYFDDQYDEGWFVRIFGPVTVRFDGVGPEARCYSASLKFEEPNREPGWFPPPIVRRFGAFPKRIPGVEIADYIAGRGIEIFRVSPHVPSGAAEYWVPNASMSLDLVPPSRREDFLEFEPGDLWLLFLSSEGSMDAARLERHTGRA